MPVSNPFAEIWRPHRYKVFYGGRGSGKSWAVAEALIVMADMARLRVLCCREIQASIRDSSYQVLKDTAYRLGIADRFHFTGFLRGEDVHRMFQLSDVYVMPSVSEPFGISPLEAMRSNVPVIISKQSGVAEVLDYALKVDYWDVDALSDAIYALITYPALAKMFAEKGLDEVTGLKWDNAAAKIKAVYQAVIDEAAARQRE